MEEMFKEYAGYVALGLEIRRDAHHRLGRP